MCDVGLLEGRGMVQNLEACRGSYTDLLESLMCSNNTFRAKTFPLSVLL